MTHDNDPGPVPDEGGDPMVDAIMSLFGGAGGLLRAADLTLTYWPYADLTLATPTCPWCGQPANIMAAPLVHPMASCPTDDCPAFTWDPTKPAAELVMGARQMVEEPLDNGGTLMRPETDEEQARRLGM